MTVKLDYYDFSKFIRVNYGQLLITKAKKHATVLNYYFILLLFSISLTLHSYVLTPWLLKHKN